MVIPFRGLRSNMAEWAQEGILPLPAFLKSMTPKHVDSNLIGANPFVVRPISIETYSSRFNSNSICSNGRPGVVFEISIISISSGASLVVTIEQSIDGFYWEKSEESITLDTIGACRIQRHQFPGWLRIIQELQGSIPKVCYGIKGLWLGGYEYPICAKWISGPTRDEEGEFEIYTVAGGGVSWELDYYPSGSDSGSGTAGNDGKFSGNSIVPGDAELATLSVTIGLSFYSRSDAVAVPPP